MIGALLAVAAGCNGSHLGADAAAGTGAGGGTAGTVGGGGGAGTAGDAGTTGGAGTTGIGGIMGGAGTTGGGGTGWINVAAFPSCLRDLFAMCPREGACRSSSDPNGGTCFASGVRTIRTWGPGCGQNDGGRYAMSTTETRKADGTLCYIKTSACDCGTACEAGTSVWTNADGQEVATETFSYSARTIRCSAGDDSKMQSCGLLACGDPDWPVLDCAAGTCP
jgi:hypothetical protein